MFKELILFSSVLCVIQTYVVNVKDGFTLHVTHLNDFHARFEETSLAGGVCKQNCIGGFSRIYTAVQQELHNYPDAIVLNAGDNFQGTLWYNIYKWDVTQHFLNKLPTDAYTLGNHEFDDKIQGVVPFIKALNAPTVAANIDDSEEPSIQGLYKKSIVIERDGKRIGVVGVLLAKTDQISNSEKLKFLDESESVNKEAERLAAEESVDTVIVLSHCGYEVEKEIARKASPKIGLVVGSHSHSFLYTGDNPPNGRNPAGDYPTVIKRADGHTVLVVQASAYSEFLGSITVDYDSNGEVVGWSGAPIYLDSSIKQDEEVNKDIAEWKEDLDEYGKEVLGKTKVLLDDSNCRNSECNIGSFITDSMVYAYLDTDEKDAWTDASIAITNPGGIRTSIEQGDITFNDLITTLPFENTLDVGELQGKYIKEALEFATRPFDNERVRVSLSLLQMSGIRVVYNTTNPENSRVQSVKVLCRKCLVPKYEDLDLDKSYKIVVTSFLANGGDGYRMIADNLKNRKIGDVDIDAMRRYIARESPVIKPLDDRIIVLQ